MVALWWEPSILGGNGGISGPIKPIGNLPGGGIFFDLAGDSPSVASGTPPEISLPLWVHSEEAAGLIARRSNLVIFRHSWMCENVFGVYSTLFKYIFLQNLEWIIRNISRRASLLVYQCWTLGFADHNNEIVGTTLHFAVYSGPFSFRSLCLFSFKLSPGRQFLAEFCFQIALNLCKKVKKNKECRK